MRSYSELIRLPTFEERFEYLKECSTIGIETFGHNRWVNQMFYHSEKWRKARREVIIRDGGLDLGHPDHGIVRNPVVHHMNPANISQFLNDDPDLYNPEYLITVSKKTHNAIHFGGRPVSSMTPTIRCPYDTCPWK